MNDSAGMYDGGSQSRTAYLAFMSASEHWKAYAMAWEIGSLSAKKSVAQGTLG